MPFHKRFMKSYKYERCAPCRLKKKSFFCPLRLLRRCLDLCMIIFLLPDFYRTILSTGSRGVNGSGVGPKKAHPHPPIFSQVPSQLLHPHPRHQTLCVLLTRPWGFHPLLRWVAPGKEPAVQGLKSGLVHPEGCTDSFEAISLLYKSLLVLRITEQIHCNGSVGTWPIGSP